MPKRSRDKTKFSKITLQAIFNAGWQAFVIENRPLCKTEAGCLYWLEDGSACVVGLLLPQDHEAKHFIGGFSKLVRKYPELFDDEIVKLSETDPTKLGRFQEQLHDRLTNIVNKPVEGESELKKQVWLDIQKQRETSYRWIARDYGLTIPGENQ